MANCKELSDGKLSIKVPQPDGTLKEHSIDLLELNCLVAEVEEKNRLPVTATGFIQPTMAFLNALIEGLTAKGIKHVSPTGAWQVWLAVSTELESLKKTMNGTPS